MAHVSSRRRSCGTDAACRRQERDPDRHVAADRGVAILVLSTEPETILTLADRVTVLKRGAVAKEFTSGRLEKADLLDAA